MSNVGLGAAPSAIAAKVGNLGANFISQEYANTKNKSPSQQLFYVNATNSDIFIMKQNIEMPLRAPY